MLSISLFVSASQMRDLTQFAVTLRNFRQRLRRENRHDLYVRHRRLCYQRFLRHAAYRTLSTAIPQSTPLMKSR